MIDFTLPELIELESILQDGAPHLRGRAVGTIEWRGHRFPLYVVTLGSDDPDAPAVGFFGGVHGLERIGTQILLAFLRSLLVRLRWDRDLHHQLESMRLVFMPLVNPAGMASHTRCNANGVDLMRNAPIAARERVPFLIGGQRLSARLPWYRGAAGAPMEPEAQALCQVVRDELIGRAFSLALDCHSGFGMQDRIWYPYAHSSTPVPHSLEIQALVNLFTQTYPDHNYLFEPQSRQYLAHGDLWDYLYLQAQAEGERLFLPLTLEMGSWLWIKKRPRQLFSRTGLFNPLAPHRFQRVMRRHLLWFDFLTRAARSHRHWMPAGLPEGTS